MKKAASSLLAISIAVMLASPLLAEEPEYGAIEVQTDLVSNYIWRGQDVMAIYARQNGEQYGANSGAWTFQPSITWIAPTGGFFVNIWGSFALEGRQDVDTDQRIQTGPGAAFVGNSNWFDPALGTAIANAGPNANTAPISAYTALPGMYPEANGTRRVDELDVTIGYEMDSTIGVIGFGLIHYAYSSPLVKSDYGNLNGYYGNEAYMTYSPAFLRELTLSYYSELTNIWQYIQLGYADTYGINDTLSIDYGLSAAYSIYNQVHGMNDISANLGVSAAMGNGTFSVSYNVSYRPELKLYEWLYDADAYNNLPVWVDGGSTGFDGMVTDPSRSQGIVNDYINNTVTTQIQNQTGNANYTYTPRMEIPRFVHYVKFSYTYLIE
ncbi:MAG: hypothetical protein CMN77_11710 [Spirochaetaceae bacterium]|nr:hypothetical protein [Spirochaetaceae bacterium]|tara:strand:- start:48932 stop:50074 length:1143 start_codon:yes stop_codon:yes gene_type:complete